MKRGSCHALMGENGAGKSTLGKILAGIHQPDEGCFEIEGVLRRFRSPLEAQCAGVGIVHQELSLCPNLSVAENICLSHLPRLAGRLDWRALHQRAESCLAEIGAQCDVREELGRMPVEQPGDYGLAADQFNNMTFTPLKTTGLRVQVQLKPNWSGGICEWEVE